MYTGSRAITLYHAPDLVGAIAIGGPAVTASPAIYGQNARLSFQAAAGQKTSLCTTNGTIPDVWVSIRRARDNAQLGWFSPGQGDNLLDTVTLAEAGDYY